MGFADPVDLGVFHVTDIWTAFAATGIGMAAAPLGLALVRGAAAASGALAQALLAPAHRGARGARRGAAGHARRRGRRRGGRARPHRARPARRRAGAAGLDRDGPGAREQKLDEDPEHARQLLAEARDGATAALVELRDLARGIRPALLAERGLAEAVRAFAARSPVPATVTADLGERMPEPVSRPPTSWSPRR